MEVRIAARSSSILQSLGRFLIAVLLLGVLALALALRVGTESTWWIELLRYTPYPLMLAPMGLALLLSLTLGWLWRLAALAGTAVVLVPVMGFTHGQTESGSGHLRVMSYNIKSYKADERPNGYELIADELRLHDADVVVMQDADQLTDGHRPMPEAMRAVLADRQVHQHGQYIVASRFPLRGCRAHPLTPEGDDGDYLRCTVIVGTQAVDLVNVHFLSPRDGLNAARRERLDGLGEWRLNFSLRMTQARQLAEDLVRRRQQDSRRQPLPLIVAGDLNAPESSPVVQSLLATGLRDVWTSAGTGYGYSHGHSLRPHIDLLRIDHILVSSQVAVERVLMGGTEGSEHRPVIADLWLSRERP